MTDNEFNPYAARNWQLGHGRVLELGPVSRIMGILNVTPDSFSDGGSFTNVDMAINHAAKMIDEGADIIDIGGESTKPNAEPVSMQLEQDRVLPVIEALSQRFDVILSIDTYRCVTARLALDAGAHMVNDITGLQFEPELANVISKLGAGVCIMHNSRNRTLEKDIVDDQQAFLNKSITIADTAGILRSQIVLDPGFGFGKDATGCLNLLRRFGELSVFELPLLAGTSRKRFTGSVLGNSDSLENRDIVTSATSVIARMAGCALFRVHDVEINNHALAMADAVINSNRNS